jgi:hypothetical protein
MVQLAKLTLLELLRMPVQRTDLLNIANTVLRDLGIHGYTDLYLTYVQKVGKDWRVSFSYTPRGTWIKNVGCFSVDEQTSTITFSAIDRAWKI